MRYTSSTIKLFLLTILFMSCNSAGSKGQKDDASDMQETNTLAKSNNEGGENDTSGLTLASKGVIESVTNIPIYCKSKEIVVKCYLKEGAKVNRGQLLIAQDDKELCSRIKQAENQFEQAKTQYEETLIGQGYKRADFANVPEQVKKIARVKTGYDIQELAVSTAKEELQDTKVTAPVSGTVTEVKIHEFDIPGAEPICRIVDVENLKVSFSILESEMNKVQMGNTVTVTTVAYNQEIHKAVITLISPIVTEDGMVKIEAKLEDNFHLMPGMTALVSL